MVADSYDDVCQYSFSVNVLAPTSIAVTPAIPSVAKGLTQQFNVTGTYADGSTADLTNLVTWASATPSVATISSTGPGSVARHRHDEYHRLPGQRDQPHRHPHRHRRGADLDRRGPGQLVGGQGPRPAIHRDRDLHRRLDGQPHEPGHLGVGDDFGGHRLQRIRRPGAGLDLAVGTTVITATLSGITSPSDTLTVTAAVLTSIAVAPVNPSVAKGLTQQFSATGTYTDGTTANLTSQVTWDSATPSIVTISSTGLAQSLATGTTNITAALGSVTSATDTLTVTAAAMTSIAVTPVNPSVAKGLAQQFTATGTYSNGSTANLTSQVTWALATPSDATISSTGLATGVAQGTSVITATLGTVASPGDTLTVTVPLVASVAIVPSVASATYGQGLTFTATVSPASSGEPTPGGTVQFKVDGVNLGPAVTLVKGAATSIATSTLGAGTHTVTAVYSGDNTYAGNSGNRGLTVAKAHLTVTADTKSKVYGTAVPTLTATISGFVNGNTANVVSGVPKLTTTATTASGVGTYPITITTGTLSAANYDFPNLVNGMLTVAKRN